MNHGGGRASFTLKSLAGRCVVGQMRRHQLDRHGTVQLAIKSLEDYAHSAAADNPFDFELVQLTEHFGVAGCIEQFPVVGRM